MQFNKFLKAREKFHGKEALGAEGVKAVVARLSVFAREVRALGIVFPT